MARRSALQDISTTPYSMRVSDTDSNLILLHDQLLSASPEEQIIRQRSRRSLFAATALEVSGLDSKGVDSPLHRTPTRDDAFTRLSRKRLLMSPQKCAQSPTSSKPMKKPRLLRRLSTPINLQEELKPYTTEELVNIIDTLVCSNPELEEEVRGTLPAPDVSPLVAKLQALRRSILRAIPATRWGSSRDAHCYRHAKPHIDAFRQTCIEQGRVLIVAHHWASVMKYVVTSCRIVHLLPTWDDTSHNRRTKAHCFKVLAAQCMVALRHSALTPSQYCDFRERLGKAAIVNKELSPCIAYVDKMLENNNYK